MRRPAPPSPVMQALRALERAALMGYELCTRLHERSRIPNPAHGAPRPANHNPVA